MKNLNDCPKTIKKTARYILQDADLEKLEQIEDILNKCINQRKAKLIKQSEKNG
ncbi:hypothetical protein MM300_07430 [Evansella sp. LMS18]|uniref:hypothetical protein n=1 Tax=Evansella sp. LMS18 TaxID=2924033 RepID=UPI0020D1AB40|nr:hypothetical protein [Evansella sp. LMS18]UTR12114.1 hypothetical protein MM300_07430 [Evansella sp. LMS18]